MKLSDLKNSYLANQTTKATAAATLKAATDAFADATTADAKSTAAFASAIQAKGGEVSDPDATPKVVYKSDGHTVNVVPMVTMDDDAPDDASSAPPATDPTAPSVQ